MSTPRVFLYARVSTVGQETANQVREVEAAGHHIERHRIVQEVISGSVAAMERTEFARLVDRLEIGDILIVTKLDRLGCNAMDVRATVEHMASMGVSVKCLALGGVDLTSASGKLTMGVIAAVAEFERDLLIERTLSGQARARSQGVRFGRPSALNPEAAAAGRRMLAEGQTVSYVARELGTSRRTVYRLAAASSASPGQAGEARTAQP